MMVFLSRLLFVFLFFPLVSLGQSPTRIAPDATGNYSVIAIMVDFQDESGLDSKDTDPLTYGTGKFVTSARDSGFLDSWPRDKAYFENHLEFLKNYWNRVSGGKLTISQTHVVPTVITLPKKMRAYSSINQKQSDGYSVFFSDFFSELNKNPAIIQDMQDHYLGRGKTHFILFHAGLGKDIDWSSILGGDPTPGDLPSLFVTHSSEMGFLTLQFPSGMVIDHLSILPETLSRTIESYGKKVLLSFGINGIMVANFGNFLGLPDLYNTKSGASGVGSFGLMDGYGFFNFNGFIPSPPSIWEKYQLGWINPDVTDISALPSSVNITPDHPLFIHLGGRHYYLLETLARNPDLTNKGVTVTVSDNGNPVSKTFLTDQDEFYTYSQTGLKGVITDVSNPYWVIPAGINSEKDTINGGLLIWRLDDSKLYPGMNSKLFSELNSAPETKVLKVMEADGSFDIGQSYGLFSGGGGSETGTIFDYWYSGNIAPLFKNEFSSSSTPSSDWAYRVPTGLKLTDFGRVGNGIRVNLSSEIKPNPLIKSRDVLKLNKKVSAGFSVNSFFTGNTVWTVANSTDSLRIYRDKSQIFATKTSSQWNNGICIIKSGDSIQTVHQVTENQFDVITVFNESVSSRTIVIDPLAGESASDWHTIISPVEVQNRIVYILKSFPSDRNFILEFPSGHLTELTNSDFSLNSSDRGITIFRWNRNWFVLTSISAGFSLRTAEKQVTVDIENTRVVADSTNGNILVLKSDNNLTSFPISSLFTDAIPVQVSAGQLPDPRGLLISSPDGYIRLSPCEDGFYSREVTGFSGDTQLSSFPIVFQDPVQDIRVIETETELVSLIKTNRSWYSKTLFSNEEPAPFPSGLGTGSFSSMETMTVSTNLLPDSSSVERVVLNGRTVHPGIYSINGRKNDLVGQTRLTQKVFSQTFEGNSETVYSWPNPSKDGIVRFRLNLPFQGSGKITLLDLSGQKVGSLDVSFSKNQETEWIWKTGQAQSGLYFASVEVSGEGKSVTKLLKVVLIK